MAYKREEMTAKYLGRMKDGVRWKYQFENPRNPADKPMVISAFDARETAKVKHDAPKLDEEQYYTFTVEHAPTKENTTKDPEGPHHHNLARKQLGTELPFEGAYIIAPANDALKEGIKSAQKAAPARQTASESPSLDYNWGARRGGLAHDAAVILGDLERTGAIKLRAKAGQTELDSTREILKLASEYHEILLGHLMDNAELAEKKATEALKPRAPGPEANP